MTSFAQRHMPTSLNDVVFSSQNTRIRLTQYASGERNDHLLLYGPYGTAKSTTARLIAEQSMGKSPLSSDDEFHASCIDGKEITAIEKRWASSYYKLIGIDNPIVIIDEIDQVDRKHQQQLRRVIDSTTADGIIILTTNKLHDVDPGLADRCDVVEMPAIDPTLWFNRANAILSTEGVQIAAADLAAILSTCGSSIRDLMRALEDTVRHHCQQAAQPIIDI